MIWYANPGILASGGIIGFSSALVNNGDVLEGIYDDIGAVIGPNRRIKAPRAGVLRRLVVTVTATGLNGNFIVGAGVDGALSAVLQVVFPALGLGTRVIDIPIAVAANADINFGFDASAAVAGNAQLHGSMEFVPNI